MTDSKAFDSAALADFASFYPERPGLLRHKLVDHPLLRLEALAELAQRMRPADVEYNKGDLPIGVDPEATPKNGLDIVETIRSIERCGSWMVLKFIEQDPIYRALLETTLGEIRELVSQSTGKMLEMEGFIFISSPDAVTPFHFDPEHNILMQIRGSKTMTVFPADDEQLVAGELHEAFHLGTHHRNLPWQEDFGAKGAPFRLAPGDAIYVPVKAPHWVKNGPEPSVSLSVTWRSEWSYKEADARGLNHILRQAGLTPSSPGRYPHRNLVKSAAYRAIGKARRAVSPRGQ